MMEGILLSVIAVLLVVILWMRNGWDAREFFLQDFAKLNVRRGRKDNP